MLRIKIRRFDVFHCMFNFLKLGNGEFMFRKIKNPLDCKEIKGSSKCFSFSRHNPRPFSLLSKHFHQWPSLGIWFLTLCLWPRALCQDSVSSVTLPTQHLLVDVSLEPQLNMVKTKFFYSSYPILFQFLIGREWYPIHPTAWARNLVLILHSFTYTPSHIITVFFLTTYTTLNLSISS